MMDVRYKRDLNSNYMIMTDAEKREEIYEDRMIKGSNSGMISISVRWNQISA